MLVWHMGQGLQQRPSRGGATVPAADQCARS